MNIQVGDRVKIDGREYDVIMMDGVLTTDSGMYQGEYLIWSTAYKGGEPYIIKKL